MSADETASERPSRLDGLLAPLRLPERLVEALDSLVEAGRELGPIRLELTRVREQTEPVSGMSPLVERISNQVEPLAELHPALEHLEERLGARLDSLKEVVVALEDGESHLNKALRDLGREVAAVHKTVAELQDDVERITDLLPIPARGPFEKARDALIGSGH